jgi:hypothetical protein
MRTLIQRKTRKRLQNTLNPPALLHGRETWTIKANEKSRFTAAEMKFMRRTPKYIQKDYKTNHGILDELMIEYEFIKKMLG